MSSQCTALNVSDLARCEDVATSVNGLFCSFHSRQCQGLYRGYKNRNARLASLERTPPEYLASSSIPIANQTFEDVNSEEILHQIYDYLALKYALLDRVIRARKLHHSRFFSLNMDYGHQNYLDILSSRRSIMIRALERLERRVGDVLYQKQKWFKWVRQCQDKEEVARENEKKKVKKEATLFKRHMKDVQSRMRELRAKEDLKRQEAYLDEAYSTRLSEEEQEAEWDPIEEVIGDERGNYVDLIKHILLMTEAIDDTELATKAELTFDGGAEGEVSRSTPVSKASKKSKKSKIKGLTNGSSVHIPDKSAHDTKSQVRQRLKEGVKLKYGKGFHVAGTIDNPVETRDKSAPLPDDDIDQLLEEMAEIKHMLFCRLLLSHATILPAAIKANSVDEFLNDKDVTDTDLRDLALKLDSPGLQEIRDACADLAPGEEEEIEEHEDSEEELEVDRSAERLKGLGLSGKRPPKKGLPETWAPEREKQIAKGKIERQSLIDQSSMFGPSGEDEKGRAMIDFGEIDDEGKFKSKKMRVKVCGKYIYNYPSERAITRGGWLQFCLIAKNSDLHDAIKLCRHWDEFFDLNVLANFQYFPAANWLVWKGDRLRQQLLQLGLIPYMQFAEAEELSEKHQTGSRGQARRAHNVTEVRNFMCANIKRNDPISRRFLQYLTMQSCKLLVLIRDARTSKILRSPPDEQLWLNRYKSGLGRASKNEWTVMAQLGPAFFEKMETSRKWHFGFNEYYDVYIWDLEAGQPFNYLYNTVSETLYKAHRFCGMDDLYIPAASTLRTTTRDLVTFRTRDIKPGEDVESIWDEIERRPGHVLNPRGETLETQIAEDFPQHVFYNEADVLEDAVLFPEEMAEKRSKSLYSGKASSAAVLPGSNRFIHDLDTDEELSETEASEQDEDPLEHESDDDDINDLSKDSEEAKNARSELIDSLFPEEQIQDLDVMKDWKLAPRRKEDMHSEFMTFMDREKSRAFKRSWHAADWGSGASERQREIETIIKQMVRYNSTSVHRFKHLRILRFLNVHPDQNRRTNRDALDARAMAMLFFSSDFLSSEYSIIHKDSLLLNQAERARHPPLRRPHTSNKYQPKGFWDEWDSHWKAHRRNDPYPVEWDNAIRPIIAKLYKAGVISNSYTPEWAVPGKAMAAKGPDGTRDLYLDLRIVVDGIVFPPEIRHPPSKEDLLLQAQNFSKAHKGARFSALRLWSAPHFYPLMVGLDNRNLSMFTDAMGRAWEWNFVPKDMPYSELSIHRTASLRLEPFKRLLGDRVIVMRDLFLVMGTDEEDLLKFTTATIFAIQTEPWRLEVDLWRSFINVDMGFLESLQAEWLD